MQNPSSITPHPKRTMYSLSTAGIPDAHDGRAMLREIRDLGLNTPNSATAPARSPAGILEAVDAGEIKISSLHNFVRCRWAESCSPNLYEFSDERARQRELR